MKPLRVLRDTDGVQRHRAVVTLGGAYDGGGVTRFVAVGGRFTVRRETGCVQHHRTGAGRTAGVPGLRRLRHVGQRCRTGRHSGSTCHSLHRRGRSVNLLRTALLRGLISISLLGEQRHDECEQFAEDCYPTASRLRFEPRLFCA